TTKCPQRSLRAPRSSGSFGLPDSASFDQNPPHGVAPGSEASCDRTHRDPAPEKANHLCSLVHVQPRHTARCVPTAQMSEHRRPVDAVLLRELLNGRASEIVPDK